jgi:hypothetical protein
MVMLKFNWLAKNFLLTHPRTGASEDPCNNIWDLVGDDPILKI